MGHIEEFKNLHNRRCFILGNGPSLDSTDLSKLDDEITMGTNSIFEHPTFVPDYYTTEDWKFVRNNYKRINHWKGSTKFIPLRHSSHFIRGDDVIYIDFERYGHEPDNYDSYGFVNPDEGVFYWGSTVTVLAIQLMYYMGCEPIYLIGCDHWKENQSTPPQHFGNNMPHIYNPTKIHRLNYGYQKCKESLDNKNVEIYNATDGGHLEIFDRVDYDDLF